MPEVPPIRYLLRREIDDRLWNTCIDGASNGLIYGYSYYLDHMAGDWDGLVLGDYRVVMPLPWRKKWSIHYLYQPPLTAQLGVFGNGLTPLLFARFLQAVPAKFRYWDFSLNHQNVFYTEGFPLYQRKNFVLPLNQPYGILWKGYRENIRRNIKKSRDYGCQVKKDVHPDQVIDLVKFSGQKGNAEDISGFAVLFQRLKDEGMACTYGIVSDKGDLLSSAVFLFSHQRAYYILVGNHPNGRTLGASHALIDAFIQDHAGKDMVLDFEGSDIRNLAFFYSSFGAQEEVYPAIRFNQLPWWAKWLKEK
jgi:hypothetical protein